MFKLSSAQSNVISEFCNDIAKGLFLGVVINQILTDSLLGERLFFAIFGLIITGSALYLSVSFSK